jgi:hypothetical protein
MLYDKTIYNKLFIGDFPDITPIKENLNGGIPTENCWSRDNQTLQ